jgi:hypothetical protein
MGRGMDLGRAESIETLVRRREAVEQRLSSSLRQAELIDGALAELQRQLGALGETGADHTLRASARALLTVAAAAAEERYDATFVLHGSYLAVRVQRTLFGLQADVVHHPTARPAQGPWTEQSAPEQTPSNGRPEHDEPFESPHLDPDGGPVSE